MKLLIFFVLLQVSFELGHPKPIEEDLIVTYNILFKNRKDSPKQIMALAKLYISDSSSLFIGDELENILRMDASDNENMDEDQIRKARDRFSNIEYFVEKLPNSGYLTYSQEFLKGQFFEYKENMMSSEIWQIKKDTITISGLLAFRAECKYSGREWTAWFSPEIPISEGPYKFSGLPGLIVNLESSDGEYQFTLAGLARQQNPRLKLPKRQLVDKKNFKEIRIASYDNLIPSNMIVKGTINGKEYNREETIQFLKKGELNKNHIELD